MRTLKLLFILIIVTLSLPKGVSAQYVQPMRYPHYSMTQQANIGVGTVRTTAASAYLEVGPTSGANKGFLPPRLSTTERDAIASPANGLMIYNKTTNNFQGYNGSAWVNFYIDTASRFITSFYRIGDSVKYVKGGIHYFAFIDSTGGSTPTLQQVLTAGSTLTGNNTITGGLYSFKFTNQNLWSVDTARQWRLRSFREADSSMQLIQSSNYGVLGLKRINISSQDTAYLSNIIIDHDHLTNEVYERNPLTLKTAFAQDYNRFSFQGDTTIMSIEANNRRVGIMTDVPDSSFHVVGGLKFVTGRQGAGKVLTSDANGGADWATPSGGSYTFTNGLTESGGTVKLGGALTQNTSITNASNYDYKLSLSEDGDNVGFIGTTYSSLLGFENGSGWLRMGSSTYSGLQVASALAKLQSINTGTSRGSDIELNADEILINPSLGGLYIDTLTSAVGTKALRYNPTTGLVSYADTTTGGSGGTPAGNYGNLQLNRNGAFATPASDSLIWASATGLTSLGNIGVGVTTSTHRLSILDNQTTRDVIKIRNLSSSGYSSIGFFGYTDAQVGGFGYANGGITGPVSDAIYFYSNSKDLVFSKDATVTSSMTIRGATGTVGIVNAFIGSATGTATARLHISAGTATASTAPLKFTSGTNLTTAEAGAMEYNGTNLFFTPSSAARNNILMTASVNSVSPTSPNRTITVVIDGTTYYIHAKTTND